MACSSGVLGQAIEVMKARIVEITVAIETGDGNSGYSIDGQSFTKKHAEDKLLQATEALERLYRLQQIDGGPIEIVSIGV